MTFKRPSPRMLAAIETIGGTIAGSLVVTMMLLAWVSS